MSVDSGPSDLDDDAGSRHHLVYRENISKTNGGGVLQAKRKNQRKYISMLMSKAEGGVSYAHHLLVRSSCYIMPKFCENHLGMPPIVSCCPQEVADTLCVSILVVSNIPFPCFHVSLSLERGLVVLLAPPINHSNPFLLD